MSDFVVKEKSATGPSADPILNGIRLNPENVLAELPDRPPGPARAPRIVNRIDWQPQSEGVVQPGDTLELGFSLPAASVLFARATWFDSTTPPALVALLKGVEVERGTATAAPPDGGTILLTARLPESGNVRVVATNPGPGPVAIRMIVGVAPL